MRPFFYVLCLTLLALTFRPQSVLAVSAPLTLTVAATHVAPSAATTAPADAKASAKTSRRALKAERRTLRKQLRQALRSGAAPSTNTLLLIIIGIFIPPLAMFLYEGGLTNRFWISLLLTILLFVPGLIYTLYIIGAGK